MVSIKLFLDNTLESVSIKVDIPFAFAGLVPSSFDVLIATVIYPTTLPYELKQHSP